MMRQWISRSTRNCPLNQMIQIYHLIFFSKYSERSAFITQILKKKPGPHRRSGLLQHQNIRLHAVQYIISCHNYSFIIHWQSLMSKKIAEKLRQVTARAKTSFFKSKQNQQNSDLPSDGQQQQQDSKNNAQQLDSRWKSLATMAQQQANKLNKVQLDYMKKKLSEYTPHPSNMLESIKHQASELKDSNIKQSLKEGANKLKDTSKQAIQALKDQAKKLEGAKESLSDALKKIDPRRPQQDRKQLQGKKEAEKDGPSEETLKWFHRQMHNSQQSWKSLQDVIQREFKTNATSRINLIQRIFQRLYWKTVALVCLIVFVYAFGSNLPRQIRKAYEKSQNNQPSSTQEKGQLCDKEVKQRGEKGWGWALQYLGAKQ